MKKIEVLWSNASAYLAACINKLSEKADVALTIADTQTLTDFQVHALFSDSMTVNVWKPEEGEKPIRHFASPDLLLTSGWMHSEYLQVAKQLAGRSRRAMAMDNQWQGTFRQRTAQVMSWRLFRPYFDAAFVPGRRQELFASKLGFHSDAIYPGLYSCDPCHFNSPNLNSCDAPFTFVGRLTEAKGISTLLHAYQRYRDAVRRPRELRLIGKGPLSEWAGTFEGVRHLGFIDPNELPPLLTTSWAFVLPSIREPWGVALHEAAASSLPLIASTACGAGDAFVQVRHNGWSIAPGDSDALLRALLECDELRPDDHTLMGQRSRELSLQYTPEKWAQTVLDIATGEPSRWDGAL